MDIMQNKFYTGGLYSETFISFYLFGNAVRDIKGVDDLCLLARSRIIYIVILIT